MGVPIFSCSFISVSSWRMSFWKKKKFIPLPNGQFFFPAFQCWISTRVRQQRTNWQMHFIRRYMATYVVSNRKDNNFLEPRLLSPLRETLSHEKPSKSTTRQNYRNHFPRAEKISQVCHSVFIVMSGKFPNLKALQLITRTWKTIPIFRRIFLYVRKFESSLYCFALTHPKTWAVFRKANE